MDVLGVLAMIVFCSIVIAMAAAVSWLVVKYSPAKRPE